MKKTRAKEGKKFVYIIRADNTNYCKIGITNDLDSRISILQTGNHQLLTYVQTYKVSYNDALWIEKTLHHQYNKHRVRGEWFYLHPYDLDEMMKLIWHYVHHNEPLVKPRQFFP